MATKWVCAKDVWRSESTVATGVWKHRDSPGYVIRGQAKCPRTGKTKEVFRVLPEADKGTAFATLQSALQAIRLGTPPGGAISKPRFAVFAAQLYKEKVDGGEIRSAATRKKWDSILTNVLFKAPFAEMFVDKIRRADIEDWKGKALAPAIKAGGSPHTGNDHLKHLRTIVTAFVGRFELPSNPTDGVKDFDTRGCKTFTVEQPNSLTADELGPFLATLKDRYPQHYAYAVLGFVCGFRPSTMRPIRWKEDVDLDAGLVLIRRSHTRGVEVMELTKTDNDQRVGLPPELVDVLKWHHDRLTFKQRATGLLFPSRWPGKRPYMARSSLTVPFGVVTAALGMTKRLTAKGMRRTAVDLQRTAELDQRLRSAISGHVTEAAQKLYETVPVVESRAAVAKVIDLLAWRRAG